MPIVKMDQLTVVGLAEEREAIIEALTRLGAVEIIHPAAETSLESASGPSGDPRALDEQIQLAQNGLFRLAKIIGQAKRLNPKKKPMFTVRRKVAASAYLRAAGQEQQIMDQVNRFEHNLASQEELRSQLHRLQTANQLLEPWQDLNIDLADQGTENVRLFLGSLDHADQVGQLEELLRDDAPETMIQTLDNNVINQRCIIATWRPRSSLVQNHLRQISFNPLPMQGEKGTPRQLLEKNKAKLCEIDAEMARLSEENLELAAAVEDYEILHDYYAIRHDRLQEVAHLAGTRSTFWLQGWVPSHLADAVGKGLNSRFLVALENRPAGPGEEFPILLKNSPLVQPFEVVAEMFSPPSSQEIDPTPWIAPFYFFFFGIMLSDVGYGLILTAISWLLIYKVKVEGEMRRISRLLLPCGIASIIWGFLFGGFFGDMLSVLSGKQINWPVLWFNPIENPANLMIWSMIFGVVHIFIGMWIKVLILFRTGHGWDAVLDICPWYLIVVGLGLAVAGIGGQTGMVLALAGAAVLLLFSGRPAKNPIKRLFKGLGSLYNIFSYFSDILSYTRILALVLATSVIAMVVNMMGFFLGPTLPGYLLFLVVAVAGHGLNVALSALSAYVHTSRLHYVEFFGKFYDGGGQMWQPLRLKTKYIEITPDP
ncbi:MAG TPA: hypothetical protein DD640_10675 [Clostridiales bacterium]|nr:hypothetical protein [Clostridiales bacterium]